MSFFKIAEYANAAAFPALGMTDVWYIDLSTSTASYWDGTAYQATGPSPTPDAQPVAALSSSDDASTFSQAIPLIIPWDGQEELDTGFTHDTVTNNTRLQVDEDGTYSIGGFLRILDASNQRAQPVAKIIINGVVQNYPMSSGYIRNSGNSSDYWNLNFTYRPIKLTASDYVEVQVEVESQATVGFTPTLIGSESGFWMVNLQGAKGETGATGAGSNIVVQKDDLTIGTLTDTLNFEGVTSATDEGSNKTTITVPQYYEDKSTNLNSGTVNASYGTPLEFSPSSGVLECTAPVTGSYAISIRLNIGTNLNADNGAIELAYGIDTGGGASVGPQPWVQTQQAKKNRANGTLGYWGGVALNAGDKVHAFISTLGDSTTITEGEIFIWTIA